MKIKYELNNVHVCHGDVCFKIPSVLVKNMLDKVILGIPFINSLYHFLTEHDDTTTDHFGQKVKFKFASKFEINTNDSLNLIHAKTEHLNFLKQEVRYKKIAEQLSNKLSQSKINNFHKILINYLWKQCKPLFDQLQNNPPPWSNTYNTLVKQIKFHVKTLPCLGIPTVNAFKIVETDASDIGYGGILKQLVSPDSSKQIVCFHLRVWNTAHINYSTI